MLEDKLRENRPQVVDAFRRLVKAKLDQWDASGEIETLIGQEIDGANDLIENIACGIDDAENAMKLPEDKIIEWVKQIATGELV